MDPIAFHDQYLEARADCWGCEPNNPKGLFIISYWDADEKIAHYHPKEFQTGHKDFVNCSISANSVETVLGEVLGIRIKDIPEERI